MSATSAFLEGLIDECGGFSRFQWLIFSFMVYSKLAATWSMMMMTFAGAVPSWDCLYDNHSSTVNVTSAQDLGVGYKQCNPPVNVTSRTCEEFRFDDSMNTVVNEWTLICDEDWVASTITTIQMAGLFVSAGSAGHLADIIGRKPTFFASLVILIVINTIAGFSTSWKMFAVLRFFLAFGIGGYLTVFYSFLSEFIPGKRRPVVIAFPAWSLWTCVFGFVAMWLHDWRYLQWATAILTAPCLLFWWIIPESFRYMVAHNKLTDAKAVVHRMAKMNGRPVPDMAKLSYLVEEELKADSNRKYTIKDILKSSTLLKHTFLLSVSWASCGYGYYAISFGVQDLSGSLYLNLVLLSAVEVPLQASSFYLTNRFGRKRTTFSLLLMGAIAGLVVAAVEISDLEMKGLLVNIFAMISKMGVGVGWGTLILLTTEVYPTVVRNIGSGIVNTMARIGAMVAPQAVYMNARLPGSMYFLFGGVMLVTTLCISFVPETKGKPMEDAIDIDTKKMENEKKLDDFGHFNDVFDTKL